MCLLDVQNSAVGSSSSIILIGMFKPFELSSWDVVSVVCAGSMGH